MQTAIVAFVAGATTITVMPRKFNKGKRIGGSMRSVVILRCALTKHREDSVYRDKNVSQTF